MAGISQPYAMGDQLATGLIVRLIGEIVAVLMIPFVLENQA
jgi:hypothetical protein